MEMLDWPFRGTDALAACLVTPHRLRTDFEAVHRNVYIPRGQKLTPVTRAVAARLWSGRTATVAGLSAAALHRTAWIDDWLPAERTGVAAKRPAASSCTATPSTRMKRACVTGSA
jgi:hypothetical protein